VAVLKLKFRFKMNITKTDLDALNAILNVKIEKADYEEKVEKAMKDLRKKASIKGFRPGMVPAGLVKKMYGKNVLIDEVNKILSDSLWNYVVENKVSILGEPLATENNLDKIDLDSEPTFEFTFEIGLSPEIDITIDKKVKLPLYSLSVDKESIDNFKTYYTRNYGSYMPTDQSEEKSMLKGRMAQLNDDGKETEDGIVNEESKMLVSVIKDEEIKKQFIGLTVNQYVSFDIKKAFPNDDEIAGLLNQKKQDLVLTTNNFGFTVKEVTSFVDAEINQELWDKIYGKDVVTSEEQFLEKITTEISESYKAESEYKLKADIRSQLMAQATFELPNDFLKKWLKKTSEKELTDEVLEKEYPAFQEDIKWQLVKEKFIKENDLKISEEEVTELAKQVAMAQFRQYGMNNVPEEYLDEMAKRILSNEKEKKRIEEKKVEDKVLEFVKESINLEIKEITPEEFRKL
jgi:trigger factor